MLTKSTKSENAKCVDLFQGIKTMSYCGFMITFLITPLWPLSISGIGSSSSTKYIPFLMRKCDPSPSCLTDYMKAVEINI